MFHQYATLIEAIAQEAYRGPHRTWVNLQTSQNREQVLGLSSRELGILIFEMFEWLNKHGGPDPYTVESHQLQRYRRNINGVLEDLCKLPFNFSLNELIVLLAQAQGRWGYTGYMMSAITKAMERYLQDHPCPQELKEAVDSLLQKYTSTIFYRSHGAKLGNLVRSAAEFNFLIIRGEVWSDVALATLRSLPMEQQKLWSQLMENVLQQWGGHPEITWLKCNQDLVTKIGIPVFQGYLLEWLPLVSQTRTQRTEGWLQGKPDPNPSIDDRVDNYPNGGWNDRNVHILEALVWLSAAGATLPIARVIASLAAWAYQKIPLKGPRCVRLGHACVWALGAMDPSLGIPHLIWLSTKVKLGRVGIQIPKVFKQIAKRTGLSRQEIEEMSVTGKLSQRKPWQRFKVRTLSSWWMTAKLKTWKR